MKLLRKSGILFLSILLSVFPVSLFAADATQNFMAAISQPLSLWPHLFLLLGIGVWLAIQDGKCLHKLLLFALGGYLLGVLFGGVVPHMLFGINIIALLLIAIGAMVMTELKLNDTATLATILLLGFFSAQSVLTFHFTLMSLFILFGLFIGAFLAVSAGFGAYMLLKKPCDGKMTLLMGALIALVGLLKLFALI